MDVLDKDQLERWIQVLTEAKEIGFSSLSSPIEPLLEVMIDLCLQLKQLLQEGRTTWETRSNKTLKFSKFQVDSLSNPKVITSEKQRHVAWDPSISFFFKELAETLVRLKASHKLPKDLYSNGRCGQDRKQIKSPVPEVIGTQAYHFYRRSRLRQKH